jgi:hypothetical protein
LQRKTERDKHAIEVFHHIAITETDHAAAMIAQESGIPSGVVFRIMRVAVDLHDQSFCRTEEIDDPAADHGLSAELVSLQAAVAQGHPQAPLGLGGFASHPRGPGEHGGAICATPAPFATTPNPLL